MPTPEVTQALPDLHVFICDKTGANRTELADVTIHSILWVLNDIGSIDFSLPKGSSQATYIYTVKREVQVWLAASIIFWGVVWKKEGSLGNTERQYIADSLLSYFQHRFVLTASLLYTNVDQATIFAALVATAQTGTYRALNIQSSTPVTGHVRSRNYIRERHQMFYDILKEFPTLLDGMDFDIVLDPALGHRTITTYYPTKGSIKGNYRLETGKNIINYTYREDGPRMANMVYVTGATSGSTKFEQNYEDATAEAEFGTMEKVVSDSQQKDVAWLLDKATKEVNLYKKPYKVITIKAQGGMTTWIGNVAPGDTVPVIIDDYDIQVNENYRIKSMKWTPSDDTIDFEFVEAVVL